MADRGLQAGARASYAVGRSRRTRSFSWCVLAAVYGYVAYQLTTHARTSLGLSPSGALLSQACLLLLLLTGFGAMGILGQGQRAPLAAMGLPRRQGAGAEFALGAALGWAGVVASILPVAIFGGLLVTVNAHGMDAVRGVLVSLAGVLLSTLLNEVLLRGYAFQRLIEAWGPTLATIGLLLVVTLWRSLGYPWTAGSLLVTLLLSLLVTMAYLRTRALWVSIGLHFAWSASSLVLFGVPVTGVPAAYPVVSTYTTGPAWLAGGAAGPEGSAVAVLVLLAMLRVLVRTTGDLRHRWAMPEIVGAGIPVDLDAAARKQHEKAMGAAAAAQPSLVQIAPVSTAPTPELPKRQE